MIVLFFYTTKLPLHNRNSGAKPYHTASTIRSHIILQSGNRHTIQNTIKLYNGSVTQMSLQ